MAWFGIEKYMTIPWRAAPELYNRMDRFDEELSSLKEDLSEVRVTAAAHYAACDERGKRIIENQIISREQMATHHAENQSARKWDRITFSFVIGLMLIITRILPPDVLKDIATIFAK